MKSLFIVSLLAILLISAGKAQSDALLSDEVSFENGRVTNNLTAYADLENVKMVDMNVSDVSEYRTSFLGEKYYVVNRSIGDMQRGENKVISYEVDFSNYALLGTNTFQYEGEEHRLSPERIEEEKSNEVLLWLAAFIILTALYFSYDFIRSRPLRRRLSF